MNRKNQWVVRRGDIWAVRGEGNSRDTSHHYTQRDAIYAAREIAQHQHSQLFIQRRNGRIRARNSYLGGLSASFG